VVRGECIGNSSQVRDRNSSPHTTKYWEEILEYYDIACDSDIERVGNQSILDEGQADLLISSSLSVTTDY
jgi:hypothetical protein